MNTLNLSGMSIDEAARAIYFVNPDLAYEIEHIATEKEDLTAELERETERADNAEDRIEKIVGRLADIERVMEDALYGDGKKADMKAGLEQIEKMLSDLQSSISGE